MIRITSKTHLFRRGGVAHPKGVTEYPDGRFSKAQLAILEAEPMLTVGKVEEPGDGQRSEGGDQKSEKAKGGKKGK